MENGPEKTQLTFGADPEKRDGTFPYLLLLTFQNRAYLVVNLGNYSGE